MEYMKKLLPSVLFVGLLAAFYFIGGSFTCASIGEFRQCWSITDSTIQSPLCASGESCLAAADDQKYNAYVYVLLNACEKAKAAQYENEALNTEIKNKALEALGLETTAQELCSSPASLTYRQY